MALSPEQGSVQAEVRLRSQRPWRMALVALAAGGIGFLLGSVMPDGVVGQPPAIDMAREFGLALPIEQQPAFADGVVTRPEVEDAIGRLTACAQAEGVTGFLAALADEGTDFHMEYSSSGYGNAVELCQLKHFQATYTVWSQQELLNNQETGRD
jgi:hypothetical protein